MRKLTVLAAVAVSFAIPETIAPAATVQLDSSVFNGTDFTYNYGGTLAPTEGVKVGSKLVILDFAGYVAGSIFSPYSFISATAEATTAGIILAPGVVDDPSLTNLVFTYTGLDFQTTPAPAGSPYNPIDFTGLSAQSLYAAGGLGPFGAVTSQNEGSAVGSLVYTIGTVGVPAIPEPATWGMLMLGFGVIGGAARSRFRRSVSFA